MPDLLKYRNDAKYSDRLVWANSVDLNQNELRHDKTNKESVRPAKTQTSLGIRPV